MVLFNKFSLGEVVHNLQTNEVGTIVGYRETADTPEYEVLVRVELNEELGASLALWPEGALETSSATKREKYMTNKKTAVFGIYSTRDSVEGATDEIIRSGFSAGDISVLLPQNLDGPKDIGTEKTTKAPEGATTGAVSGAAVGGVLGLLAGLGALAIPGVGPLIAAGPIMAALAGVGVGGAVGGVTGALIGMGIPEYEAKRYEGRLKKGGILFSVHCDTSEEIKLAKKVMELTGGEDIASTGESSSSSATSNSQVRTAGTV